MRVYIRFYLKLILVINTCTPATRSTGCFKIIVSRSNNIIVSRSYSIEKLGIGLGGGGGGGKGGDKANTVYIAETIGGHSLWQLGRIDLAMQYKDYLLPCE